MNEEQSRGLAALYESLTPDPTENIELIARHSCRILQGSFAWYRHFPSNVRQAEFVCGHQVPARIALSKTLEPYSFEKKVLESAEMQAAENFSVFCTAAENGTRRKTSIFVHLSAVRSFPGGMQSEAFL